MDLYQHITLVCFVKQSAITLFNKHLNNVDHITEDDTSGLPHRFIKLL
jgi:hypothetical protein